MDYFHFGRGKEPLVILPGLSIQSVIGAADAVADAYSLLADDFTLYLFDRRKDPPASYSIREMAADTITAIHAVGLKNIHLFGASQGGMIAMQIAIDEPGLVKKMILGSTTPQVTEARYKKIGEWAALAKRGNREALYLAFGEAVYPEEVFEQYRDFFIESSKSVTDDELAHFVIYAEGTKGFDVTEELGKIRCPVLALGAADDGVLGPDAAALLEKELGGRRPDAAALLEKELGGCGPDAPSLIEGNSGKQGYFESFTYDGYVHAAFDTAPDYRERMRKFLLNKMN